MGALLLGSTKLAVKNKISLPSFTLLCQAHGGPISTGVSMSTKFAWPEPSWLASTQDDVQAQVRTRFFLCLAAAYCGERGNHARLARTIGMNVQAVHSARERGQVSPEMAIAIESALGRELFPRELFRPDLFTIPAE